MRNFHNVNMEIFILLGTNQGDKIANLNNALNYICAIHSTHIKMCSSVYCTAAWGKVDQPDFYNMAICIESMLSSPFDFMHQLLEIEKKMGRERRVKWDQRIIDIDIIYVDQQVIETEKLIVPHPEMHKRRFVLEPLVEIEPMYIHPKLKVTNKDLLLQCIDNLSVSLVGRLEELN